LKNFYLLNRGWMDNPALNPLSPYDRRSAWVWIIENACFKDTRQDVLGQTTVVVRTSLVTSVRYLAKEWKWSEKQVRTFLKRLVKDEMIRTETGLGKTQIFVINYDSYQFSGQVNGTVKADEGQQKKEGKKRKEIILIDKGEFSTIMKQKYPKRDGNLEITSAYNKILSKVKKGEITFDDFFFAVENYNKEMSSVGRVGTSFVKMASTFANGKYKDYLEEETQDNVEGWTAF
jgi:hypothetical protein